MKCEWLKVEIMCSAKIFQKIRFERFSEIWNNSSQQMQRQMLLGNSIELKSTTDLVVNGNFGVNLHLVHSRNFLRFKPRILSGWPHWLQGHWSVSCHHH